MHEQPTLTESSHGSDEHEAVRSTFQPCEAHCSAPQVACQGLFVPPMDILNQPHLADSSHVARPVWTLGDTLRLLRKREGWTQHDLADKAGVGLRTVIRLESEEPGNYQKLSLAAVAGAFGWTEGELLNWNPSTPFPTNVPPPPEADLLELDTYDGYKPHDIPVIAEGEASPQGALFWETEGGQPLIEVDEWMSRPGDVTDPRAYAVRVRGDSMVPAYYPGMRLIVTPNTPVKSGARVYVELHSGERLVKVARRQKQGWILESLNPAYEARFVTDDEIGTMHKIVYAREL
jgi:phage repressor protein C with HTH and peptisase S24 domain